MIVLLPKRIVQLVRIAKRSSVDVVVNLAQLLVFFIRNRTQRSLLHIGRFQLANFRQSVGLQDLRLRIRFLRLQRRRALARGQPLPHRL